MRLFDVRGRYLDDWRLEEPGMLGGRIYTRRGQRISNGLYLGWIQGVRGSSKVVRVLICR